MKRVLGLLAFLAAACQATPELPFGPTELVTGVIVYEHANFLGTSAHITTDIPDLSRFNGPCVHESSDADGNTSVSYDWNDCISSIRVAPGWRVTVYRGANFRDDAMSATSDMPNLQLLRQHDCPHDGLNDCVSSVRLRQQ
jgi:hypothetical protein